MSTNATTIYSPFTIVSTSTSTTGGLTSNSTNCFTAQTSVSSFIIKYNLNFVLETNNWIATTYCGKLFADDRYIFYGPTASGTTGYCYNVTTKALVATYNMTGVSLLTSSVTADNNYVYFSYPSGNIYRYPIEPSSSTLGTPWLTLGTTGNLITYTNNKIYVYSSSQGMNVYQANDISLTANIINTNFAPFLPKVTYLSIDSDLNYIYMNTTTTVVRISSDNGLVNPVWAGGFSGSGLLTVSYPYLYIRDTPSSTILRNDMSIVCFKEDSLILTDHGYVPIQELRKGDLVRTLKHGYVPVCMIGKRDMYHPASSTRSKDQLYQCSSDNYPEVFEPLIITGCHSILVDKFVDAEQKKKSIEVNKGLYSTDNKFRLPACVDERATVYDIPGNYTIYHFALENDDYYMNYGVYANGLLVETCSKRFMTELSNMEII